MMQNMEKSRIGNAGKSVLRNVDKYGIGILRFRYWISLIWRQREDFWVLRDDRILQVLERKRSEIQDSRILGFSCHPYELMMYFNRKYGNMKLLWIGNRKYTLWMLKYLCTDWWVEEKTIYFECTIMWPLCMNICWFNACDTVNVFVILCVYFGDQFLFLCRYSACWGLSSQQLIIVIVCCDYEQFVIWFGAFTA